MPVGMPVGMAVGEQSVVSELIVVDLPVNGSVSIFGFSRYQT